MPHPFIQTTVFGEQNLTHMSQEAEDSLRAFLLRILGKSSATDDELAALFHSELLRRGLTILLEEWLMHELEGLTLVRDELGLKIKESFNQTP